MRLGDTTALWAPLLLLAAMLVLAKPAPSSASEAETPLSGQASAESLSQATAAGAWTRLVAYVRSQQRDLHRALAGALRQLRAERSATAAWSLILLSFLYGLFHAAGPGHGKAVIGTYLLTHKSAVGRGLLLSAAASLMQGLVALLLVWGLVGLIGWSGRDAQGAVGTLESASFGLIALLGAWLVWRAAAALARRLAPLRPLAVVLAGAGQHHEHRGCGHDHGPDPSRLERPLTLRAAAAMVVSIGIRPCSGAVLVLLVAEIMSLRLAGAAAVLAMSLGTALAVAVLALLAVNFRHLASRMAGSRGGGLAIAANGVALLGGLTILVLGASLFLGSLGPQHPLL